MKTSMLVLGTATLSMLFASQAWAGCGKDLAVKLAPMAAGRVAEPSAEDATPDSPLFAPSMVGLWLGSVSVAGQVVYQGFESFTIDGLEFLNDNSPTLEGNVCFGVWTATGRNAVKVYHPAWNYDANGNLIGTVTIRSQITLDPSGNSFKGTVIVDTYDLNGHVAAPEFQGQLSGKRITAN